MRREEEKKKEKEVQKKKKEKKQRSQRQIERLKQVRSELKRRTETSCIVSGPLSVVLTDSPEETDTRVPRVAEVRDAGTNTQSLDKDPAILWCFQRWTLPSCEQQQFPQPLRPKGTISKYHAVKDHDFIHKHKKNIATITCSQLYIHTYYSIYMYMYILTGTSWKCTAP